MISLDGSSRDSNEQQKIHYALVKNDELRQRAREITENSADFLAVITIDGDRISCCDEGIVASSGNKVVGLSTIAPKGQSGNDIPEIVGTYVLKNHRAQGVGKELLVRAFKRCKERNLIPVRVVAITKGGAALVESLPQEIRDDVKFDDQSSSSLF